MSQPHLIAVPYDSGHRAMRMGAGPLSVLDALAHSRSEENTSVSTIECTSGFPTEIGSAFELHAKVADTVHEHLRLGRRPIVLSGNCNSSLGSVAGAQRTWSQSNLGVAWFDGHGDCNTPETFTGDFLDAMGISTLTGKAWQGLVRKVEGFRPIDERQVVLVGAHGADEGASSFLRHSRIEVVPPSGHRRMLLSALSQLRDAGTTAVYLHIDLDVIDPRFGRANEFAPDGGLAPTELLDAIRTIDQHMQIVAVGLASFDPAADQNSAVLNTILAVLQHFGIRSVGELSAQEES